MTVVILAAAVFSLLNGITIAAVIHLTKKYLLRKYSKQRTNIIVGATCSILCFLICLFIILGTETL